MVEKRRLIQAAERITFPKLLVAVRMLKSKTEKNEINTTIAESLSVVPVYPKVIVGVAVQLVGVGNLEKIDERDKLHYFIHRHLLRPFICHHYAEHQPSQSQRPRQASGGALHFHE